MSAYAENYLWQGFLWLTVLFTLALILDRDDDDHLA